ncbi:DNA modification methylase [gut metagenome]|uniref:DNA modification methylase n=1 Tax=gut metagenome TaxID=749906 RepID=J9CYX8_9ZZZZ
MLELNKLYNMDCMQGMKEFPDGFFDLAIVDPPYGIGIDGQKKRVCSNPKHNRKEHIRKNWDKAIPPPEYFRELERVSKSAK